MYVFSIPHLLTNVTTIVLSNKRRLLGVAIRCDADFKIYFLVASSLRESIE